MFSLSHIHLVIIIMCTTLPVCYTWQVSATFAASLVISPALGTYIETYDHGEAQVIILATMITLFNLLFIIFMVPESLQDRRATWGTSITWEQADPFAVSLEQNLVYTCTLL